MALKKSGTGGYESPNFQMIRASPRHKMPRFRIEARTVQGQLLVPVTTVSMSSHDARALVATLERQLRHGGTELVNQYWRPSEDVEPITPLEARTLLRGGTITGEHLRTFREALFPGLTITEGRTHLAKYLDMSVGHIRHMENDDKPILSRTVRLLRDFARNAVNKSRQSLKADQMHLNPFFELYDAMTMPEETPEETHTDEPVREAVVD